MLVLFKLKFITLFQLCTLWYGWESSSPGIGNKSWWSIRNYFTGGKSFSFLVLLFGLLQMIVRFWGANIVGFLYLIVMPLHSIFGLVIKKGYLVNLLCISTVKIVFFKSSLLMFDSTYCHCEILSLVNCRRIK